MHSRPFSISLLKRSPETVLTEADPVKSSTVYLQMEEEKVAQLHGAMRQAAEGLRIAIDVTEHVIQSHSSLPMRKDRRKIAQSTVVVGISPHRELLAFVAASIRNNPVLSAIVADMDDTYESDWYRLNCIPGVHLLPTREGEATREERRLHAVSIQQSDLQRAFRTCFELLIPQDCRRLWSAPI